MYAVDKDQVVALGDIPRPTAGAPEPIFIASERSAAIAYYLWEAQTEDSDSDEEPVAVITFPRCYAHMFGLPNDETLDGHPLYKRGLESYRASEVKDSSWILALEKASSINPLHDKEKFLEGLQHIIITFHDGTFECITDGYEVEIRQGPVEDAVPMMLERIGIK